MKRFQTITEGKNILTQMFELVMLKTCWIEEAI